RASGGICGMARAIEPGSVGSGRSAARATCGSSPATTPITAAASRSRLPLVTVPYFNASAAATCNFGPPTPSALLEDHEVARGVAMVCPLLAEDDVEAAQHLVPAQRPADVVGGVGLAVQLVEGDVVEIVLDARHPVGAQVENLVQRRVGVDVDAEPHEPRFGGRPVGRHAPR